jgi:hypothetical protein
MPDSELKAQKGLILNCWPQKWLGDSLLVRQVHGEVKSLTLVDVTKAKVL